LTIGKREGSFPGVLQERTFRIVWGAPGHGAGVSVTGKTDAIIPYSGQAVPLSTARHAK
jgi:alpha-D-xyloside xylohydrolase